MNQTTRVALGFALIWIILKMILFNVVDRAADWYNLTVMANVLLLLLAIFVTMHFHKTQDFLTDFKEALKGGVIYTIIVASFIFLYVKVIDTGFIDSRLNVRMEQAFTLEQFNEMKELDPVKLADKSYGDFLSDKAAEFELVKSPFIIMTLTIAALLIASVIYSLLITILYRRLLNRFR